MYFRVANIVKEGSFDDFMIAQTHRPFQNTNLVHNSFNIQQWPLAGYTLYDHKTNNSIRKELRITSILDKIDEYRKNGFYTYKECHKNEFL